MKHKELAALIQADIDSGFYKKTGKLPTEDQLMEQYDVTRYCVRNAIDILVSIGRVIPIQGSGMFIRETNRDNCISVTETKGMVEGFKDKKVTSKLLNFQLIAADGWLSERMHCDVGTSLYRIKRLRFINDENIAVEDNYYNKELVNGITPEIAVQSLYNYVKNELGMNISFADKVIFCEKLDAENSKLLSLCEGDPALVVINDAYLSNGKMFAVSKSIYNYKKTKLFSLSSLK